ncbi:unnamed protein product [Prunus armeniaca]
MRLQKQGTTIEAAKILIMLAQMWFGAIGQGRKSFNYHPCWEVVKNCSRFKIILTSPTVVLNETPLYDSMTSDAPLDSPMSQDLPIQKELRLIGRKVAKAKRGSTSTNDTAKHLEQIALNSTMKIGRDMKEKWSIYANKTWRRRIEKPWSWIQAISSHGPIF